MKTLKMPSRQLLTATFNCRRCDATLQATASEGVREQDRDGIAYVFTCPHCHDKTWVAEEAMEMKA